MPRAGLTAAIVLEAATVLADEMGLHAVTISSLAKQLNVKPPSLYNHISSLADLHNELALLGLEKLYLSMEEMTKNKSGDERIYKLCDAYIQFARRHPGLYEATLLAPDPSNINLHHASEKVIQLTVEAFDHYELDNDMSIHIVRGLRSLLHGFASLEFHGGFGLPQKLDESFQRSIKTFLNGI